MKKLPDDTDLFIWTSNKNQYLTEFFPKAKIVIIDFIDITGYNKLLSSTEFWANFLNYERILIFQHDSIILRKGIEKFLEMPYGYIGSPWLFQNWGGNGGISLRDPTLMLYISHKYGPNNDFNEDIFFSNLLKKHWPERLGPPDVCERWGTETIFKLGTFCTHAPEKHMTKEQLTQLFTQYDN